MNILNYINKINEIYGKDEPRNMAQGGRIGFAKAKLVGKINLQEIIL